VPPTVPHAQLIAAARREIRALPCPRGIRKDGWGTVLDLLAAIAGYLPDCWPSERTLAKKLSKHQQAVHRTLNRARELGLVSTTVRPLESSRDGQSYHLLCLSEGLRAAISRQRIQTTVVVESKISYSVGDQTASPSGDTSLPAAPVDRKDNVVPFNRPPDDDWSSPAIGEDPLAPLPATAIKVDPAVYLARQFDSKWADVKRRHPELRVTRSSSRGAAIGYLRKVMLPEITPEHVEAYMDEFILAAVTGDVQVKEGQFAWERFTAWWGRADVEDPAIHAAAKASAAKAVAAARAYWAEQDQRKGLTNG
jgi:hypothetical protein